MNHKEFSSRGGRARKKLPKEVKTELAKRAANVRWGRNWICNCPEWPLRDRKLSLECTLCGAKAPKQKRWRSRNVPTAKEN